MLTYSDRRGILYYDRCSTTVVATTNKATSDRVKADEGANDEVTTVEDNPDAHRAKVNKNKRGRSMIEISSDVIRGYNDTMILFLLKDAPSYGYEISKKIKSLSEEKYLIKETTLYSAFTRMEKNGYIESYSQNAENGKKRTYYRITDKGKEYYSNKCEEWNLTKDVIERFIERD